MQISFCFQRSPRTPELELDANFSQILKKKREEQLEASKQRLLDSTLMSNKSQSLFETNESVQKSEVIEKIPVAKRTDRPAEMDNSMMFGNAMNKSWNNLSGGEDSFLALERQCNMDEKREQLLNANDTLLFDVEPPSEMWNQTVNQSLIVDTLDRSHDDDSTVEISPVKYVGLMRPSTIIEETSSQMESSSKNSTSSSNASAATKSSLYATASMINDSGLTMANETSARSCCDVSLNGDQVSKVEPSPSSTLSFSSSKVSPLASQNERTKPTTTKTERQRRGTFAFKRANYTFFPNENLDPIDEKDCLIEEEVVNKTERVQRIETPKTLRLKTPAKAAETRKKELMDFGTPSNGGLAARATADVTKANDDEDNNDEKDQFNNTLERVDYLLEKGKQILEETPISKRTSHQHQQSMFETPLFSCKRKRLLGEMASMEMLPLPKRGPLIDFSTPEITNARVSKFVGK